MTRMLHDSLQAHSADQEWSLDSLSANAALSALENIYISHLREVFGREYTIMGILLISYGKENCYKLLV